MDTSLILSKLSALLLIIGSITFMMPVMRGVLLRGGNKPTIALARTMPYFNIAIGVGALFGNTATLSFSLCLVGIGLQIVYTRTLRERQ